MDMDHSVCIKIGGRAASQKDALDALAGEVRRLAAERNVLIVHGGGADVTSISKVFGLEAVFVDGVRMTSPEEMDVVDMVLSGRMNKYLVRRFRTAGVNAVGLSGSDGGLFSGRPLSTTTHTGRVTDTDTRIVETLMNAGYVPVVSSTSMGADGAALNINADEVALALAVAIAAEDLVFISDIPGILKERTVIQGLSPDEVEREIEAGVIAGGMIPKVRASVDALEHGVARIVIGEYAVDGDLTAMLGGDKGTTMYHGR